MINPIISVIVPVYNAEKYLRKCIDSVLSQTFMSFELLLINDGSRDNSKQICDEYLSKDERVYIYSKDNGGVSSARNLGLEKARGEWVTFIDSDDYIAQECFQTCINAIVEDNLDLLQFSLVRVDEHDNVLRKEIEETPVLSQKEYIEINKYLACIGGSFFKREIIKNENIFFDIELKLAEDQLFVLEYMHYCKRIRRISTPFYKYLFNSASSVNNTQSKDIKKSIIKIASFSFKDDYYRHINECVIFFIIELLSKEDISNKEIDKLLADINYHISKPNYLKHKVFFLLFRLNKYLSFCFFRILFYLRSKIAYRG